MPAFPANLRFIKPSRHRSWSQIKLHLCSLSFLRLLAVTSRLRLRNLAGLRRVPGQMFQTAIRPSRELQAPSSGVFFSVPLCRCRPSTAENCRFGSCVQVSLARSCECYERRLQSCGYSDHGVESCDGSGLLALDPVVQVMNLVGGVRQWWLGLSSSNRQPHNPTRTEARFCEDPPARS